MGTALALMGLLTLTAAPAERADVQVQIEYLLTSVASSGCDFFRNGSWYGATQAAEHLRFKYQKLWARDLIGSAEDFIEKGATRSSISGLEYAIRCPGAAEVPAARWLRERLAGYRSIRKVAQQPPPMCESVPTSPMPRAML
jgi:hypothetical protein